MRPDPLLGSSIERHHLEYFVAAADCGGFSAAAQRLFVSHTSITRAIHHLERTLSVMLFVRTPAGAVLTPEGSAVVGPARLALSAFEEVAVAADKTRQLESGRLLLSALPTLAGDIAADLISAFHREFPGVRIQLMDPPRPYISSILEAVEGGAAHVGLTEHPSPTISGFKVTPLPGQPSWAVFPGDDSPHPSGRVTAAQVAERGMIVGEYWESSALYRAMKRQYPAIDECVAVRTSHRESMVDLALQGAGVAVVDASTAQAAHIRGAQIACLDPAVERPLVAISLERQMSSATYHFHQICAHQRTTE